MKSKNNTPIDILESTQYKLDGYFDSLPEIDDRKNYINNKISKLDTNLSLTKLNNTYFIKEKRAYCPHCHYKNVVENGYYPKKIIIKDLGTINAKIKRYICKRCKKSFSADLTSIVDENFTISKDTKEIVQEYYSIDHTSVRKICEFLEKMHNIKISRQEVQDILVDYRIHYNTIIKEYSGYYVFDALWVKIKEVSDKWVFLLALVDACHDTIISYKIVEHETEEEIYNFLRESTRNQPRIAITTDLKHEYKRPIDKLGFKHQFCVFHFKQNINKTIREYAKNNKLPNKKIQEYKSYLSKIYQLFNSESTDEVTNCLNNLKTDLNNYPNIIKKIVKEKILPYAKYLTRFIENPKIEKTSNLIERMFEDLAPKHIKKIYKTTKGFLSRFNLKLKRWDERNAIY